jgi:hypothetical protein
MWSTPRSSEGDREGDGGEEMINKKGETITSLTHEEKASLSRLLELLKTLDLDAHWLTSVGALSAQEIAIKKKLSELGISYSEDDFQKLAERLEKSLANIGMRPPQILLAIGRSYRHIRAGLQHDPRRSRISKAEAEAILNNTAALMDGLSSAGEVALDIQSFVDSIVENEIDETLRKFESLAPVLKKKTFSVTIDRMTNEAFMRKIADKNGTKKMFDFLRRALREETDLQTQIDLFEQIFSTVFCKSEVENIGIKEELLSIVDEFCSSLNVKSWIRGSDRVNPIISGFEASETFSIAAKNARIVLKVSDLMTRKQLERVVDSALNNNQIYYSWNARDTLKEFLSSYESKIPKKKLKELRGKMKL